MELIPLREAKGIYFTVPIKASKKNEPYKEGRTPCLVENMER
jgi:hypothetical protein